MSLRQSPIAPLGAALAGLAVPAAAQPDLVILVRHAERAATPAADPALTPAGELRAQALARALADAGVTAIVTTQFRRTRDTAAPLAQALGVQPEVVDTHAGGAQGHVQAVAAAVRAKTGTVLVVGHSNTVPAIVAALGGPALPDFCETSFGNAWVLKPGSRPGLLRLSYGARDPEPAPGCL